MAIPFTGLVVKGAQWLWKKITGRPTVQVEHGIGAGGDITGPASAGSPTATSQGGAAVGQARDVTVVQGFPVEDHDMLVRMMGMLTELKEGALAPPTGSAPTDTQALAEASTSRTEELVAEAVELQRQHKEREAIECLLEAYRRDLPPEAKIQLHILAGNGFLRLSELREAESHYQQALDAAKARGDREAEAVALDNLGLVYASRGDLDKAEERHGKALAIQEEIGNRRGQAHDLGNLGLVYFHRGEMDKAEEHHKKALAVAEEVGDRHVQANQLGNLGLVYFHRGEMDKAEEHLKMALANQEEIGDRSGQANQLGNLGLVYASRGDLDKAEEHHKKSVAILEEIGNRLGQAQVLGNLGNVYGGRSDLDKAEEYYNKALAIHEEIGNRLGQATQLGNLGLIYKQRGEADEARKLLDRAAALYEAIGAGGANPDTVRRALRDLEAGKEDTKHD
jgi:tetratricopeptide (TPR) repeat protein